MNITFESFEAEKQTANKGGLVASKYAGQSVTLTLDRKWEKNGHDRTNGGKGSLGVITSEGWLNASKLIAFLGDLDDENEAKALLIEEVIEKKKVAGFELVIDSSNAIEISFDADGNITEVKAA